MKKKVVVFDNSGTLTRRDRVLKDIKTGKLYDHLNSLEVIYYSPNSVLVVLQTDPAKCLLNAKPGQTIYQFIMRNNIDFDVSYSNKLVSKEEILEALKNDQSVIKDVQDTINALIEKSYDVEICSGSGFIIDVSQGKIEYAISSGGKIFPEVKSVIEYLKNKDIGIYIASGDRKGSLQQLAKYLTIPLNNVFPTAHAHQKREIVKKLKIKYKVMMVGNSINDALALEEADLGVLTTQQKEDLPMEVFEAADLVIKNIKEIKDIEF